MTLTKERKPDALHYLVLPVCVPVHDFHHYSGSCRVDGDNQALENPTTLCARTAVLRVYLNRSPAKIP